MADGFPCPNPMCNHEFTREAVRNATSLRCPSCGKVFQFRNPSPGDRPAPKPPARVAPAPPPPVAPTQQAVPVPPPAAPPAPKPIPLARPVVAAQPPPPPPTQPVLQFTSQDDKVERPVLLQRNRRNPWMVPTVLVVALFGTFGIVVAVLKLMQKAGFDDNVGVGQRFEQHNFSFRTPASPWEYRKELALLFKSALAFKRSAPTECGLAIEIKDYQTRYPDANTLITTGIDLLNAYFVDANGMPSVAWQPRPPATREKFDKQDSLGGQPAWVIEYQASREGIEHEGECYIMQNRGWVYWFITFSPKPITDADREATRNDWQDLRERFALLEGRPNWTEQERPQTPFTGTNYRLTYATGVWQSQEELKGYIENAELVLLGIDPKEDAEGPASKAGKAALLQLALLPSVSDPDVAARKHYLAYQQEFQGKDAKIQLEQIGKPETEATLGKFTGHLSQNRLMITGGSLDRFVLIAAVPLKDQLLTIYGECEWNRKDFWEKELSSLLTKLQPVE